MTMNIVTVCHMLLPSEAVLNSEYNKGTELCKPEMGSGSCVYCPLSTWNKAFGCFWVYYNEIPIYPIFYLLKEDSKPKPTLNPK